jgi:parallel beta-helix repeat protein
MGWPGSGAEEDPYIIEDISIEDDEYCVYIANTTAHFEIRNSIFRGNGSTRGVTLYNVTHAGIIDCSIQECSIGLGLYSPNGSKVKGCDIGQCSRGIDGFLLESCEITANYIWFCIYGMVVGDAANSVIQDNTIQASFGIGLLVIRNGFNCGVMNNTINRISDNPWGAGMYLTQAIGWNIEDNKIANATVGILSVSSKFCMVEENTITDMTGTGIVLSYDREGIVRYNGIQRSLSGIALQECQDIAAFGNEFHAIGLTDFHLIGSRSCSISNNSLERGILIWDHRTIPDVLFWEHTIYDNTLPDGELVYLSGEENLCLDSEDVAQVILVNCNNVSLSGATLQDGTWGAVIAYSQRCSIHESELVDNNLGGVYICCSQDVIISQNTITGNRQYPGLENGGIKLRVAYGCNITGNLVYKNEGDGVLLNESSGCLIYNNLVANNTGYGIRVDGNNNLVYGNAIGWNAAGNAFCDGFGNFWYFAEQELGNYWSDYEGEERYTIEGNADSEDRYPNSLTDFLLTTPISEDEETDMPQDLNVHLMAFLLTVGVALTALAVLRKKDWI